MFVGPSLAPSLRTDVELAGADCPSRLHTATTAINPEHESRPFRSDMTYTEKDLITTIDRLVPGGPTADGTTAEALQYLDQYHVGGSPAVERLLVTLMPSPSDIVLDIGSGLGGPARQVATASGCRVTGVDITEAYVKAAAELTDRCGLSDRVRFVHRDIADLVPEQPFDAGFTMHVQMNIEAKQQWFAEIAQRLAPAPGSPCGRSAARRTRNSHGRCRGRWTGVTAT